MDKHLPKLYDGVMHKDIRDLIDYTAETYGDSTAFTLKHKKGKEVSYEDISFRDFRMDIRGFATYLKQKGYSEKRIAIIGANSYEWLVGYFAAVGGLGVVVPLDKGLPFEEIISSLERSEADLLIYNKAHKNDVLKLMENNTTSVKEFIEMENVRELAEKGISLYNAGDRSYDERIINSDEMAIMLFTSGTTSQSKAVMLSHKNIVSNIYAVSSSILIQPGETNMAFLPFHHTLGSTGQMIVLHFGARTTFCDGLKYLQKNLVEYKVSVFICVPLLIEGIYKKVISTAKKQGKEKLITRMTKLCNFLLKFGIDIRRKVFRSVLEQLGGEIRLIVSGGAAIDKKALEGFQAFGITTFQGYGLTETSPLLSVECFDHLRLGSVGKPIINVDIEIDSPNEDGIGEIIAKGPNVMLGYYNNEEETAKVLENGWFRTGDLGKIDKDGYLYVTGRQKNVIVLKNGKNIYPEEIETLISNLPYVEENMVFGKPKQHDPSDLTLSAKIVYNREAVKEHFGDVSAEELNSLIEKDIDKINNIMPSYKQIKKLYITDIPAVKTTTAKIKRFEEIKNITD